MSMLRLLTSEGLEPACNAGRLDELIKSHHVLLDTASFGCGYRLVLEFYNTLLSMAGSEEKLRGASRARSLAMSVKMGETSVKYYVWWEFPAITVEYGRKTWTVLLACLDKHTLFSKLKSYLSKGIPVIAASLFSHRVLAHTAKWLIVGITGYAEEGPVLSSSYGSVAALGITCAKKAFRRVSIDAFTPMLLTLPLRIYPDTEDLRTLLYAFLGIGDNGIDTEALNAIVQALTMARGENVISCLARLGCT